jgi:hypothetical protein
MILDKRLKSFKNNTLERVRIKMQKKSMKRIVCVVVALALLFAQFPMNSVFAEPSTVSDFEWSDEAKTQIDIHNSAKTIPLVDFANMFGWTNPLDMVIRISKDGEVVFALTDIITDLKQIISGGLSLEALSEIGITLEGDAHYTIEKGKVDVTMNGWKPSFSVKWSAGPEFSTKIFDILTVNSNKAYLVKIGDAVITDSSSIKVYRDETPAVSVSMEGLVNYTVAATVNGETVLTEAGTYTFAEGLAADTTVDVLYVEDTESTVDLGTVSGFETIEHPLTAAAGSDVTIKVTPNPGYYINSVAVKNGNTDVEVAGEYIEGVWTGVFKAADTKMHYTVDCESKQVVVLSGNTVAYNEMMEISAIKNAIYVRIDQAKSAPLFANIDDLVFEYNTANFGDDNWKALDYIPEGTDIITKHAFGLTDTETIRISYKGDGKQFVNGAFVFKATLVDARNANVAIDVNEAVAFVYDDFTNEDILNALLNGRNGVYDTETGEAIDGAVVEVPFDLSALPVGEHEITVKFAGNAVYAECAKTVIVTVLAAPADVTVTSQHIKPGQEVTMETMVAVDPAKAGHITFVMGLDAVDEETVMQIDISNMLHVHESLKPVLDAILGEANNKSLTVAQLEELMTKAGEIDAQLDLTYVKKAIEVLCKIEGLEGVGELKLTLSTDGKIDTSNVGAYIIGSMITDVNYEFDADFGYLVITPDMTKVTIAFNDEINAVITVNELKNSVYDMSAHVIEEEHAAAQDKLVNIFCGITEAGEIYVENVATNVIGAYTQVAYINDIGNEMYYAIPVARAYVVVPSLANITFVDDAGNAADSFKFVYDGDVKKVTAVATNKDGLVLDANKITYKYVGLCTDATTYESTEAPVKPGVYTVMALYQDSDKEIYGAAFAQIIIEQADSQFEAKDVEVEFDGNAKFIDIINPNALAYLSVIVNDKNINILVPETWDIDTTSIPVEDIVNEIFALIEQMPEMPEIPEIQETVAKLSEILNNIKNYQVTINAAKPSEVGTYDIFALAFGINHKATLSEAVLTITEAKEDPTDPSEPTDPEEPENTCKCCDACTGAEGCECACGECDFCAKSTVDPEEPADPEDPIDPSEPEDPTTPSEPDDGDKDNVDEPKLGDDPKNNSFMFFGIIGLAVVALVVEIIVLFKNKKEQE